MANYTTGAQRYNKKLDAIFESYFKHQNSLPPCRLYGTFLEIAVEKLHISKDEARNKYGLYTVQQWETLLELGWNTSANTSI